MRKNSGCLLVTIAFVFTKQPVELRLVILPRRVGRRAEGAGEVCDEARLSFSFFHVHNLWASVTLGPSRPSKFLTSLARGELDRLHVRPHDLLHDLRDVRLPKVHVRLDDYLLHVGRGGGAREVVALPVLALEVAQDFQLILRLDALGDNVHPQNLREQDDGADDLYVLGVLRHARDERAVYLQGVNRELVKVAQGGVARAEVVYGELDADVAELAQHGRGRVYVVHDGALGDFELEAARADARPLDDVRDLLDEERVVELLAREVDADEERRAHGVRGLPAVHLPAGLAQGPLADGENLAGLFGDGDEVERRDEAALGVVPAYQRLEA